MEGRIITHLFQWLDEDRSSKSPAQRVVHFVLRLLAVTCKQFAKNSLSLRSSAMTYTLLLSLVPILAMSTAIVKGLGGGNQLKNVAYSYIDTLEQSRGFSLPGFDFGDTPDTQTVENSQAEETTQETLTAYLRIAVDKVFAYVERTNFATLGSFGVIGIFFTVLLMLNHVETAMNVIWQVKAGRSLMRKISDYITLLVLLPFSINITFATSALLRHPRLSSKLDIILPFEWLQTLVFQAIPVFFITLSLFVMYIFFPNTKVKTIPAMLGALLAGLLWFIMQNIYINLQVGVAKYNAIYGTFASAPLFLAWIYLGWVFVLVGAQFAWSLQNIKRVQLLERRDKPSIQLAAAFDIVDLVYEKFSKQTLLTKDDLSRHLHYDTRLSTTITEELLKNDILYLAQSNDRLLPAKPKESFPCKEIINLILGQETSNSTGGEKSRAILNAAQAAICKKA